jgi:hypothetical protein
MENPMSQEQEVFVLADKALQQVINQITPEQWEQKVTEPLAAGRDMNLRTLINYHAYDEIWIPDTLAGKTVEEVGDTYKGDLLGTDPIASYGAIVDKAIEAVNALTEADLAKTAHLTYGDFPVREYLVHITTFRGFRAYTIAKFLGVDSTLSAALVDGLWDEVASNIDWWREVGVFGPEIPVPEDADKQTKLLGMTGFLQA